VAPTDEKVYSGSILTVGNFNWPRKRSAYRPFTLSRPANFVSLGIIIMVPLLRPAGPTLT
jgi:hypothetical protein